MLASLPVPLRCYVAAYLAAVLCSVVAVARRPRDYELVGRPYWRFLLEGWRVGTFVAATGVIAGAAPFSGDPTWDLADSILISVLVFLLAPWSVATIYRELRGRRAGGKLAVAVCAFFVPCWAYDLYILFRDGLYPDAWAANLGLSGPIILCAGLFWNLGSDPRSYLSFKLEPWPPTARTELRRIVWAMLLVAAPVLLIVAAFLYDYLVGVQK